MIRSIVVAMAILGSVVLGVNAVAAELKIAIMDSQMVINQSNAAKRAVDKLKAARDAAQRDEAAQVVADLDAEINARHRDADARRPGARGLAVADGGGGAGERRNGAGGRPARRAPLLRRRLCGGECRSKAP